MRRHIRKVTDVGRANSSGYLSVRRDASVAGIGDGRVNGRCVLREGMGRAVERREGKAREARAAEPFLPAAEMHR